MIEAKHFTNAYMAQSEYKRLPQFPRISSALTFCHSNSHSATRSCTRCFPQVALPSPSDYVDLLEFANFGGKPWPLAPGASPPSRWAADLRYTWSTTIPHKYPAVHDKVLSSNRVMAKIKSMTSPSTTSRQLKAKAGQFICEIRASLSRLVCRVCGYLLFKIFRKFCSKLLVVPSQMETLKKTEKTGVPLVYLPLHRSHLDYLLITWANWHFGLRLPHIASGDNLNLSGFGWLLRATGAFFIRRRLAPEDDGGKDQSVLHSYIDEILSAKLSLEFFLEGTRNRFGKPLLPKNGLISNVVEAVQQGVISDCYLVPVSITYDQVAEGVFLNELMGIPKNLWMVLKGMIKGFGMLPCGVVRMNFGQPVLLTEYLSSLSTCVKTKAPARLRRVPNSFSYRELLPWNSPKVGVDRALVRGIGLHVIYEAAHIGSIHLSSVLATVMLCKYRDGSPREHVERDVEWLCERLIFQGYEVVGWQHRVTSSRRAVDYAHTFLGDSLETTETRVKPVGTHRSLVRLAYSRNALLPALALKAALGLALSPFTTGQVLALDDVIDDAILICEWMHFETIFCKPCESLRDRLTRVLLGQDEMSLGNAQTGAVQSMEVDKDGESVSCVKIRDGCRAREILLFHSNLLRPFFQSYAMTVHRLIDNIKPRPILSARRSVLSLIKQAQSNCPSNFGWKQLTQTRSATVFLFLERDLWSLVPHRKLYLLFRLSQLSWHTNTFYEF
ncbi:acl-6 [Pristionchus pacificus]|uniref:Acl-6 n=1 Tax=Pristionchus pacificus TaxID=54126 RepID=A0A2A6C7Y6_PRIPA|nr:acl-6 [Pristionchus pacificus]|eukprot:PDM74217.1 acl-6 [Pristionchus pacificus]